MLGDSTILFSEFVVLDRKMSGVGLSVLAGKYVSYAELHSIERRIF